MQQWKELRRETRLKIWTPCLWRGEQNVREQSNSCHHKVMSVNVQVDTRFIQHSRVHQEQEAKACH
jgi:hypothetical protein